MSDKLRCLMIGAGGMAAAYVRNFLPVFADRVEVAGLVDVKEEPLQASGDFLGLPQAARFTDMQQACDNTEADFCIICIPPKFHKNAVLLAAERKLDVLSEKPIADTWDDCAQIYRAAKASGIKMQIVQNYRYNATMLTMKHVLDEGSLGRLNYVMGRFAADYRVRNSWGSAFRHEIEHSLLIEGSVHHFDMLRNLSGANCRYITGWEWNLDWSSFDGQCNAHYLAKMTNGVVANYEGNCNAAALENSWHKEMYRAECEKGAVIIDRDGIVRVWEKQDGLQMREVPLLRPRYEGHNAIIDQFLTWKEGGPAPATIIEDNLQSAAMLFGAIMASDCNQAVDVQALVAELQ